MESQDGEIPHPLRNKEYNGQRRSYALLTLYNIKTTLISHVFGSEAKPRLTSSLWRSLWLEIDDLMGLHTLVVSQYPVRSHKDCSTYLKYPRYNYSVEYPFRKCYPSASARPPRFPHQRGRYSEAKAQSLLDP